MRSVLNLISLLALGLIVAAVMSAAPTDTPRGMDLAHFLDGFTDFDWRAPALDYRSVVAGLGIGVVIALIAQISWAEIARRTVGWISSQAHRLLLLSLAGVLLGVIVYL